MNGCKRVAAIQDLSGLGRCSLTVIIPTLSAMGVQVCPVPTAVLSAHTGYSEFVIRDLTDFIHPALEHYKRMNTHFDCIYSGFLASAEQIDHCLEFFSAYPDALKVVDPVMGDDGKSYATYTGELCKRMGELVEVADIITPNITEAAILLGEEYPSMPLGSSDAKSWLVRLSGQGERTVVITSVNLAGGGMHTIGYDRDTNSFWKIPLFQAALHIPPAVTSEAALSSMLFSLWEPDMLWVVRAFPAVPTAADLPAMCSAPLESAWDVLLPAS